MPPLARQQNLTPRPPHGPARVGRGEGCRGQGDIAGSLPQHTQTSQGASGGDGAALQPLIHRPTSPDPARRLRTVHGTRALIRHCSLSLSSPACGWHTGRAHGQPQCLGGKGMWGDVACRTDSCLKPRACSPLIFQDERTAGRGRLPPRGDAATRCFRGTRQRDLELRFEPTQWKGRREGRRTRAGETR